MTIGNRIRHARRSGGVTKAHVARATGVDVRTIQRWEGDETIPTLEDARKLAAELGVSVDWLATGDGAGPAESAKTGTEG